MEHVRTIIQMERRIAKSDEAPRMNKLVAVLDQVNIVVTDMETSVEFYRLLGLDIPDTDPAWQSHHRTAVSEGLDIDLDSEAFARKWNGGSKGASANSSVLGFKLPTREAVDEVYGRVIRAGYKWVSRYAVVEDPDGNPVGLMSPPDPNRRSAIQPPE
jgi:catechol 2,3-dioxygenase-like lactoylglutathione lyase family enzyme